MTFKGPNCIKQSFNITKLSASICTSLGTGYIYIFMGIYKKGFLERLIKHLQEPHPCNLITAETPVYCHCSLAEVTNLEVPLFAQVQPGTSRVCPRGSATLPALQSLSHGWATASRLEKDQRWLKAAKAGRWTSGALRRPLPVRQRAPGLQPSGVNLSVCQTKYCKSLAITETVKGQMQFPELFTQLEDPLQNCQEEAELGWEVSEVG